MSVLGETAWYGERRYRKNMDTVKERNRDPCREIKHTSSVNFITQKRTPLLTPFTVTFGEDSALHYTCLFHHNITLPQTSLTCREVVPPPCRQFLKFPYHLHQIEHELRSAAVYFLGFGREFLLEGVVKMG